MSPRAVAIAAVIAVIFLSDGFAAHAKAPDERQEQRGERRRQQGSEARQERTEHQRRDRRRHRIKALRARFGAALKKPALRAELELHARRKAKLNALRAVAEREGKRALLPRIEALEKKEQARHEQRLAALAGDAGSGP
jgi:hypothetical protein